MKTLDQHKSCKYNQLEADVAWVAIVWRNTCWQNIQHVIQKLKRQREAIVEGTSKNSEVLCIWQQVWVSYQKDLSHSEATEKQKNFQQNISCCIYNMNCEQKWFSNSEKTNTDRIFSMWVTSLKPEKDTVKQWRGTWAKTMKCCVYYSDTNIITVILHTQWSKWR